MLQFFFSYDQQPNSNVGDGQEMSPQQQQQPVQPTGAPKNNGVCHGGQWISNTHANQGLSTVKLALLYLTSTSREHG